MRRTLADLEKFDLIYLATPYSKYAAGMEQAFRDAASIAAVLVLKGVKVYSPICHTHPIAVHGGIDPLSHNIWLPFDEAMMNVCEALVVVKMQGWEDSYGINYEIDYFTEDHKMAFYLDPVTLELTDAPAAHPFFLMANDNDLASELYADAA